MEKHRGGGLDPGSVRMGSISPLLAAPPRPGDTIEQVSLRAVFEQADVITLHLPSTAETRDLIGADLLSRMRPGALLVNAARGDLVDEAALVAGLAQGRPAAAAIDVFRTEPPEADHPFLTAPNLLLTPHIAGGTQESLLRRNLIGFPCRPGT